MLLPPFTVMIIKNTRRPVTIRVTWPLAVAAVSLIGIVFVAGTSLVEPALGPVLSALGDREDTGDGAVRYILAEPAGAGDAAGESPRITDLTVDEQNDGGMVLSFSVSDYTGPGELLFWMIINPDARETATTMIIPRNPLFRGVPVDYRNGIRYLPARDRQLSFTLGDGSGGDIEQVRILAYSSGGDLVIERTIALRNATRM